MKTHVFGIGLITATFLVVVAVWISVQSTRPETLPTLVWAPDLTDAQVMEKSPLVLDRLGRGWWWVYANREERLRLGKEGVLIALAMPTPLAVMAGCSIPPLTATMTNP